MRARSTLLILIVVVGFVSYAAASAVAGGIVTPWTELVIFACVAALYVVWSFAWAAHSRRGRRSK